MKRFDDRTTCFHSGKKISPPMNERRLCACCGLRIVKGFIVEIGHVGEDCAGIIERRNRDRDFHGGTVKDFAGGISERRAGQLNQQFSKHW